jgi:hypothetical protein
MADVERERKSKLIVKSFYKTAQSFHEEGTLIA